MQQESLVEQMKKVTGMHAGADVNLRRWEARQKDDAKMLSLIRRGRVDIQDRHNLALMIDRARGLGWKPSRFMKALERVGSVLEGRNPDGSWPDGTLEDIRKKELSIFRRFKKAG